MQVSIPHDLQRVIDFVNTRDVERGTDELRRWIGTTDASDLAAAAELREALRAVMAAHNGGPPADAAVLERVAREGELSVRFTPDGSTAIEPRAPGFAGRLAALLVPIAHAEADGTWPRVKACGADGCRWAFYDGSRNRSGRWCDMAVCGNRTKVRNYRERRGAPGRRAAG